MYLLILVTRQIEVLLTKYRQLLKLYENFIERRIYQSETSGCSKAFVNCKQVQLAQAVRHEIIETIMILLEHCIVQGCKLCFSLLIKIELEFILIISKIVLSSELNSFYLRFLDCNMKWT